jgi:ubiquinone biosynthesis protein UbiJ
MAAELASLRDDVTRLQRETAALRAIVERLARDRPAPQ